MFKQQEILAHCSSCISSINCKHGKRRKKHDNMSLSSKHALSMIKNKNTRTENEKMDC